MTIFLLVVEATVDKVLDGLKDFDAEVYQTSLSEDDEAKIREAFVHEEEA